MKVGPANVQKGEHYRVWLNGVMQHDAVAADDVAGTVEIRVRDASQECTPHR